MWPQSLHRLSMTSHPQNCTFTSGQGNDTKLVSAFTNKQVLNSSIHKATKKKSTKRYMARVRNQERKICIYYHLETCHCILGMRQDCDLQCLLPKQKKLHYHNSKKLKKRLLSRSDYVQKCHIRCI